MLKGIFAISGQQGLFKMVAESKNNIIVESLETKKRIPTYSSSKVSALEDIAIYTETGDIPLKEIFKAIYDKEEGALAISHKSSGNELKNYFEEIAPDFDKDRVYVSDIKKVMLWYNILHEKEMLDFSDIEEKEDEKEGGEDVETTENDAVVN
ncbi:MAG: DUF5606 domain-containing protein [Prolixibacteraceae bacterium]|jgi:hypothetical protein|nr:DUF5606 domain-containing protein [Prolixibacteraceae bacterium]MBT6006926.1 DUF5606 domain-containing protein [Prolixibacteraceae bacterium]MBT6765994.1 DUF5606 domain-containing protein [Prolixibacteraceae bacterium]MBT6996907.1 DUF5606 domain-containing protein [Prolixibacteraceae bacterium]MBT7393774.1 DUF5606 domain-containing protein [Prolixibacteraceae bacterium]